MKFALRFPRFGKTLLAAALAALVGTGCASPEEWNEFAAAMRAKGYPVPDMQTQGGTQVAQAGYASTAGGAIVGDITSAKALEFLYGVKASQYSRPQKSSEKQSVVEAYAGKIMQHAGQGGSGDSPLGEECWEFVSWKPPVDGKYREYFEHHEEYLHNPKATQC